MSFRVKSQKRGSKKINYKDREIGYLLTKYKGKLPVNVLLKESYRIADKFPEKLHKKNQIVIYNKRYYMVKKVTPKGVYLAEMPKSAGYLDTLDKKSGKLLFVPDKKYMFNAVPVDLEIFFASA